MSKWTDIRDGALDAVKHGAIDVVEETKQQFLANFIEAGVPIIEEYAAQFTAKSKISQRMKLDGQRFAMPL